MDERAIIRITRELSESPELLLQEAARRRLSWFAQYVKPDIKMTAFHSSYYRVLDLFASGRVRNLIIQAAPQHGKSEASSRLLPSYMLGRNPDLKIAICSYAATIAKGFNRDCQRIIDSPEFRDVFPDVLLSGSVGAEDSGAVRTQDAFEIVGRSGSLIAVGRGGALTSRTVDIEIFDDLYKDAQEANSPVIRAAAWDWYTKVALTRLHNDSQKLIVFTRWHKDDIIGHILASEKVRIARNWADFDSLAPDEWVLVNFEAIKTGEPSELDPREPGAPLWPERHSLARLEKQREIDPVGFMSLYQGNPASAEGQLFQPFKTWVNREDFGTFIRSGCYVDVADEGNDFLCAICYDVLRSGEEIYNEKTQRFEPLLFALVTDVTYTDEPTDVTAVTVPRMVNLHGSQKVWIESNNGGSLFEKEVRKRIKGTTAAFYQSANKEARIITNAPFVNAQVVMPYGWENRYPRFFEHVSTFLREFSANTHDDGVDALVGLYEKEIAPGNVRPYGQQVRGITVH